MGKIELFSKQLSFKRETSNLKEWSKDLILFPKHYEILISRVFWFLFVCLFVLIKSLLSLCVWFVFLRFLSVWLPWEGISGVATGVARGQSATPGSEKNAKNREKSGKIQEKSGKRRKNREEKAKIGKFLSLCHSWQIELATLLEGMYQRRQSHC